MTVSRPSATPEASSPGAEPAQAHAVHQRHDRAGVAPRLGHLEHLQRRRGDPFVGLEAAQRGLAQGRVARAACRCSSISASCWMPVARRLLDDPLDFGRDLLDARLALRRSSAAISSWRATSSPT